MSKKSILLSQACEGMIRYKQATGKSEYTIADYRVSFKKLIQYFESDPQFAAITSGEMIDIWVDCGNHNWSGQVLLSTSVPDDMPPFSLKDRCLWIPSPRFYHPELFEKEEGRPTQQALDKNISCAELAMLEPAIMAPRLIWSNSGRAGRQGSPRFQRIAFSEFCLAQRTLPSFTIQRMPK